MRHSRKFSAQGFVLSLFKAVVSGKASFNSLAAALGQSETSTLSRQALHQRIDESAVAFMISSVGVAMEHRWSDEALVGSKLFKRVLIEDSSQAKTHKGNAEDFPAHGNDRGKTAGCKVDLAFDLLTGEPVLQALHRATEQDRELGKDLVDVVQPGDLVLRDMGYFSLAEFTRIESASAYWLSRLPANVGARNLSGRTLEDLLRKTKRKKIDCRMLIGEASHEARLIAVRATAQVAQQRRRERRQEARKRGTKPSKDMLVRDGWHLMITNVGKHLMNSNDLFALYATRWQIEITFRAWKQSGGLVEALARRSNPFHLQCLIYAAILLLALTMKTASLLRARYKQSLLSIEKIAHHLAAFLLTLTSLHQFSLYNPDSRHLRMDKRTRKSLHQTAVTCLP